MSEIEDQHDVAMMTAGDRLRAAREALGLSVEDVATSTRIPTRHLTSLETGDFARLPAPTYSVGFAKSYAGAVGLDRNEIGEQLRAEIGGTRLTPHQAEQFEPMDPARAMPRWLIVVAIGAIIAVALAATWFNNRSRYAPDEVAAAEAAPPSVPATPAATPRGTEAVTITATGDAWVQVKDGATMLKEGVMKAGERFEVPPAATAPTLTTGKAEALTISVGTSTAPQVGPAATKVRDVSLLPAALLLGPVRAAVPAPAAPAQPAPRPAAKQAKPARQAKPVAPIPDPASPSTAEPTQPPAQ